MPNSAFRLSGYGPVLWSGKSNIVSLIFTLLAEGENERQSLNALLTKMDILFSRVGFLN